MANRRFIDFPVATTVGANDIILIWQDGLNKQTTKATILSGLPEDLEDLADVNISGLTNGQILRYDSTTGNWVNSDQGDIDLNDLNDVSIVSPANGQVLVYNSSTSKWENSSAGLVPYVGAVTTVDLGAQGLRAGYVRFDTAIVGVPQEQGVMFWDADDETIDVILNGYTMKIGEDLFYPVKNQTGSRIAKGTAVRFAGTLGASGRLLIEPFIANGTVPSSLFMGVTAEEILNGEDGKVLYFGRVRGINTDAFNEGDILYASTTVAGGYQTAIPVAPNNIVQVAAVVTKHVNNGTIFVRPTLGSSINKDEGVKITSVADKNLLQYQSGTGLWENKTLAQVLGGTSAQFVKGNGSLDSTSYQPLLTNPVTGTGTTNRLAKFSGASTIQSSNIIDGGVTIFNENPTVGQFAWQFNGNTTTGQSFGASVVAGTNSSDIAFRVLNASASTTHLLVKGDGNLIVGTTSDNGARLQVSGTATITGSTNQQLVLDFTTASGGFTWQSFRLNGTNRYRIFGNTDNSFTLYSDILSANVLSIASSGNVGIGTTSPSELLQISKTQSATTRLQITNAQTGTSLTIRSSVRVTANDRTAEMVAVNGDHIYVGSTTNHNTNIMANGGSVLTATPSGNVGIGTSSPSGGRLQVNNGTNLNVAINTTTVDSVTTSRISSFNDAVSASLGLVINGTPLVFTTSDTERMRITSGGNVLIGTTTDAGYKLDVNGSTQIRGGSSFAGLILNDSRAGGVDFAIYNGFPAAGDFTIRESGVGNYLVIKKTTGAATFSGSLTAASLISASATFSNFGSATAAVVAFADGNTGFFRPALNTLGITTAGTERMRITSSGNVLIGTTTDAGNGILQVNKSTTNAVARFTNARNTSGDFALVTDLGSNCNNTSSYHYIAGTGGADKFYLYGNGTYATVSDRRLKKNIESVTEQFLEKVLALDIVTYNWNDQKDGSDLELGMIAQQVETAFPSIVKTNRPDLSGQTYKSIQASALPYILIKAIQELKQEIDTLKN